MEESNDTGKIIGALLIGAAIGGVLGVLFAPAKGSETGRKIMSGATDLAEELKNKMLCEVENAHSNMEEKI